MSIDQTFQEFPYFISSLFYLFFGVLYRSNVRIILDQLPYEVRFIKLESHFLRKTALVKFKLRSDNNYRSAGIIHPLTEKVASEPALFPLKRIGE